MLAKLIQTPARLEGPAMKLFILYDDSATASKEDMALAALSAELKKMNGQNHLCTLNIDPHKPDFELIKKAINQPKEILSDGSV